MRKISTDLITKAIKEHLINACYKLDKELLCKLNEALNNETDKIAKEVLNQITTNAFIAENENIPLCQDTGIAVIFLEIGADVHIIGDLEKAINTAVKEAYKEGYLRKSVVGHPLKRENTLDNTPAIIHTKIVKGDIIKITVCPKGAGSENMSALTMLSPSMGMKGVKDFVIKTVINASGKACPPLVVGVGIGGNFEKSAILAKEALLRPLNDSSNDEICLKLEQELLKEINELNIGPMGLGGNVTALTVKVNYYPCHIASLPVAVNLSCHAHRQGVIIL